MVKVTFQFRSDTLRDTRRYRPPPPGPPPPLSSSPIHLTSLLNMAPEEQRPSSTAVRKEQTALLQLNSLKSAIPEECFVKQTSKSLAYMVLDLGMWAGVTFAMLRFRSSEQYAAMEYWQQVILSHSYLFHSFLAFNSLINYRWLLRLCSGTWLASSCGVCSSSGTTVGTGPSATTNGSTML